MLREKKYAGDSFQKAFLKNPGVDMLGLQDLFLVLKRKLTTGGSVGLEKQPWFRPHIWLVSSG